MAISKHGWTLIAVVVVVVILCVLETQRVTQIYSLVSPVAHEDGQLLPHKRQKREALPSVTEYDVDVELNLTDIEAVDSLRKILQSGNFSLTLGPSINLTHIEITTVCYQNGSSFQCRCEDQFVWSYNSCMSYGACDEIINDTCTCISNIPSDGLYCTPKQAPPIFEYELIIEVNTTDLDQLRSSLQNLTVPVQVNSQINISQIVITTVCSPSGAGFLCSCEEGYVWPCDQCDTNATCENGTRTSDGQLCQSIHDQKCPTTPTYTPNITMPTTTDELNSTRKTPEVSTLPNTTSNTTTPTTEMTTLMTTLATTTPSVNTSTNLTTAQTVINTTPEFNSTTPTTEVTTLMTTVANTTANATTEMSTDSSSTVVTTPASLHMYIFSIELNTTDPAVINVLRTILRNSSYPIRVNNSILINSVDLSTVCNPNNNSYQCICEEQYRWSCDLCLYHGSCDSITNDTCGCINGRPDGQYCQPLDSNFTVCPSPTPPSPTPPSTTVTTPNVTASTNLTTAQTVNNTTPVFNNTTPTTEVTTLMTTVANTTANTTTEMSTDSSSTVVTTPASLHMYIVSIELNTTDPAVINVLRTILRNSSYPIRVNNSILINSVDLSTVCNPNNNSYQCICEEQYRWSCDLCLYHGSCDSITNDTCGCINGRPDGQYCQPLDSNFTVCPSPTPPSPTPPSPTPPSTTVTTPNVTTSTNLTTAQTVNNTTPEFNSTTPTTEVTTLMTTVANTTANTTTEMSTDSSSTVVTTPASLHMYIVSIELNTTDPAVINVLRTILRNSSYPIRVNNSILINSVDLSTVCNPNNNSYQCICEEQYRWSCDLCLYHGSCDSITNDTCGCINGRPDGQYCQPLDSNFTVCPSPTPPSPTPPSTTVTTPNVTTSTNLTTAQTVNNTTPEFNSTTPTTEVTTLMTTVANTTANTTTEMSTDSSSTVVTTPASLHMYIVSIELNTTDPAVINVLRTILRNSSYPIRVNNSILINSVDLSTVCNPNNNSYQCICEEQYRWSCDLCLYHGSCDSITNDTCGCINGRPDGQYCQPLDSNFTVCPSPTPPSPTPPSTTVTTPNVTTSTNLTTAQTMNNTTPEFNSTTPTTEVTTLMTTVANTTANTTTEMSTDSSSTVVTTPASLHMYIVSIELNTTDPAVINVLRTILRNSSYPIRVNNSIFINSVDLSTVCNPNNNSYQCICEEQYRWSCDLCLYHGSCDSITNDTCGCINGRPDGQYCQPLDSNFTVCPSPTPPSPTPPSPTPPSPTPPSTTVTTPNVTASTNLTTAQTVNNTSPEFNSTTPTTEVTTLMTTVANTTANTTTEMSTDSSPTVVTNTTPEFNSTTPITEVTTLMTTVASTTPNTTAEKTTLTPTVPITNITLNGTTEIFPSFPPTNATTILSTTQQTTGITITSPATNITVTTNGNAATAITTAPIISTTFNITTETKTTIATTPTSPTTTTPVITTGPMTAPLNTTTTVLTTSPIIPTLTTTTSLYTTTALLTTVTTPITITEPTVTTDATSFTDVTHSTDPTTASTTAATSTAPLKGLKVSMSFRLDKQFEPDLVDPSTEAFQKLRDDVEPVLRTQYRSLTGFLGVTVNSFSAGSVVTQYTVETKKIDAVEMRNANNKVVEEMDKVIPVIGGITAYYTDSNPLTIPSLTYTGKSMTLSCGSQLSGLNLGEVSEVEWKFNEWTINDGRRYSITVNKSNTESSLTINEVILADIGEYECTLKGEVINYIQKGSVTADNIKQAPNIRLSSTVHAECDGTSLTLTCCVQLDYMVTWSLDGTELPAEASTASGEYCIKHTTKKSCESSRIIIYKCQVNTLTEYSKTTTLTLFPEPPTCDDATYGTGKVGDLSIIGCEKGQVGNKTAKCQSNGKWKLIEDLCIVDEINDLLIESGGLSPAKVPSFVEKLSDAVETQKEVISESSNSISAIVEIVQTVSNVSEAVTEPIMTNVLEVVDELSADAAAPSWQILNTNKDSNTSSMLLGALEQLSENLEGDFSIITPRIMLNRTTFNNSFSVNLNSSITVKIPDAKLNNVSITVIAFFSLKNIIPPRDASFNTSSLKRTSTNNETVHVFDSVINAGVVLIKVDQDIDNVTLTYEKRNDSLTLDPRCVFWNYQLLDELGAWDTEGCKFVSDINNTVRCDCSHLTSFSILMSTHIPKEIRTLLDIITYIGVGISLGSLVICLIIEGYVWKDITKNSTALMRHVSIVNTALCLLIADICFIIAAAVAKNPLENPDENYKVPVGPCSTATFFMHFFYLALFFWMLVSGLLLFYRTVMIFSHMSNSSMLAIGFCVGYGAPLIIAVITVAATASRDGYIRKYEACWLNWDETMALLALVIPALTIVFINIIILFVVLYKMLRSGGIGESDEKHTLKVIVRCVLILTPLFGLTWSLGVGTMVAPTNKGIHIAFAFFNSLQGLFILIFGTLYDSKIRALLARKSTASRSGSSSNPRTTSGGTMSTLLSFFPGRRNVYHLQSASNSGTNDPVEYYSSNSYPPP